MLFSYGIDLLLKLHRHPTAFSLPSWSESKHFQHFSQDDFASSWNFKSDFGFPSFPSLDFYTSLLACYYLLPTTETMSDSGDNSHSNNAALLEELSEFCGSDSLSEGGLRAIIERHGSTRNNDPNINKYDFFHEACENERISEGILRYLLEYFPAAVRDASERGRLPLHNICRNKNATLVMVQLLIDAYPESVSHENNKGCLPLHLLCCDDYVDGEKNLDDVVAVDILMLLVERYPGALRHFDRDGDLPIHIAATYQSLDFCRILIEAYPGSERITDNIGWLPFHSACQYNTVATAKYLYELYPESINVAANNGAHPIHNAIVGLKHRKDNPETAIEMTQFLLDCNPNVVLQDWEGNTPFIHLYQWMNENEDEINENPSRLNECLKILQILYDAYPEVIESDDVTSNLGEFGTESHEFVSTHLAYARQARDRTPMTTRDENGQLPLHKALRDNVNLGSIKLLVKGNPSAISCADNTGMIPLHVASQHHESAAVVDYLIGLDSIAFRATDFEHNTALHFACRGAKYDTITLLLEKYGSISISKRNAHNKLPIHLLLESNEVSDRDDIKYMESIFRLLKAYPETVMDVKEELKLDDDSNHSGKKRKFGTE